MMPPPPDARGSTGGGVQPSFKVEVCDVVPDHVFLFHSTQLNSVAMQQGIMCFALERWQMHPHFRAIAARSGTVGGRKFAFLHLFLFDLFHTTFQNLEPPVGLEPTTEQL